MATLERFEDLVAWQKARVLTRAIYQTSNGGPFAKDFGLRDQIRRAATSIMSNIAEGFERRGPGEFYQFLNWALGSCAEVRSQLYIALDAGYLPETLFNKLMTQTQEVARITSGLQSYIETCRPKPSKRRPSPRPQLGTGNRELGTH